MEFWHVNNNFLIIVNYFSSNTVHMFTVHHHELSKVRIIEVRIIERADYRAYTVPQNSYEKNSSREQNQYTHQLLTSITCIKN